MSICGEHIVLLYVVTAVCRQFVYTNCSESLIDSLHWVISNNVLLYGAIQKQKIALYGQLADYCN